MIFDINEIPDDGLEFNIKVNRKDFDIDQPDCSLASDVTIQGTLRRIDPEVYFDGNIDTELMLNCSRCLESFRFPVKTKVTARYVPRSSVGRKATEHEIHDGDVDIEYYDEDRINLRPPVHDQILLTVPVVNLCREDCKGLCPICGNNLNEKDCKCSREREGDPRLAILKSIKDKLL